MGVPASMPAVRTATMRYCTQATINCLENTVGYVDLFANAPNGLEAGLIGKAFGWDQWAALFDKYVCVGSKLTAYVSYRNQVSTNPPMCVGVYLSDDTTVPYTNWKGFVEARKGSYRHMTALQEKPVVIKSYFSARKFLNITDPKDNLATIGAPTSGVNTIIPDRAPVFIVWGNTTGAAVPALTDDSLRAAVARVDPTPIVLNVNIIMDFIVRFFEPKDLLRSTQ